MITLNIHAAGQWTPGRVVARWVEGTRRIVPEVELAIEQAWQAALARPGVRLFDGPMCRLEHWQVAPERLEITLSRTSYKPFLGTHLSHPSFAEQFGRDVMANPVGVSPALETSDGYLLLGRRNHAVAYYPGRTHPFAGALEPGDADVFAAVRRELREELSLTEDQVPFVACTGVVEDLALRQPELIFAARTTRTRRQIEAQVERDEHGGSAAVLARPDEVRAAAADPALTPVAAASLLLWGKIQFGQDWFNSAI